MNAAWLPLVVALPLLASALTAAAPWRAVRLVLLMTDGDFNIGRHSTTELVELVEERRVSGVTFTA